MRLGFKHRSGFTLAEALMAMTILAVATAGVLLPFSAGAAEQTEGAIRTLAAKLASDKIEDIVKDDFSINLAKANTLAVETENQGQVKDTNGVVFAGEIYSGFSRTVSYQVVAPWTHPLLLITADVGYKGRNVASISTWLGDQ